MKKAIVLGIFTMCIVNIYIIGIETWELRLGSKSEALANNCEKPVETKKGMGYVRYCYNADGSSYISFCCDPDDKYKDTCQGRACGNSPKF